ncbi:MAG: hypothetical protein K2X97_04840 [Mycobacteriaceae bacterium]|nr:hypothetical protein [Mycobacteriaceae bacterium]
MTDITIDRTAAKQAERDAAVVRKLKSTSALVLLLLAATSFAAGVPGLLDAGRWARLGEMAWLTPIAIDGGLVFFSASAMAWRAETAKASALGWTMVWLLSAVSVAAQIAHVLGDNANPTVQDFVGAGVASMFPLLVLASTRQFEMLRFSRAIEREASRVAALDALNAPQPSKGTKQTKKSWRAASKKPAKATPAAVRDSSRSAVPAANVAAPAAATPVTASSPPAPAMALVGQTRTVSGASSTAGEAQVAEWVRGRVRAGERPSAATVAEMLGKSKASGLRLVNRVVDEVDTERSATSMATAADAWSRPSATRAG